MVKIKVYVSDFIKEIFCVQQIVSETCASFLNKSIILSILLNNRNVNSAMAPKNILKKTAQLSKCLTSLFWKKKHMVIEFLISYNIILKMEI